MMSVLLCLNSAIYFADKVTKEQLATFLVRVLGMNEEAKGLLIQP
ncbi:hypothetical protein MHI37_05480 [Paenibacillus sp. FSL H8-0548]|nr:hypothetical protein [Paenibacillus sp. FSL H8-0548]